MGILDKLRDNGRDLEKRAQVVKERQREYQKASEALAQAQLEFTKTIEKRLDLEKELAHERAK